MAGREIEREARRKKGMMIMMMMRRRRRWRKKKMQEEKLMERRRRGTMKSRTVEGSTRRPVKLAIWEKESK